MNEKIHVASARHLLKMLEEHVCAGTWTWHFGTDEHRWSAGLYKLFELEPHQIQPCYEAFASLLHPDDKLLMPSSNDIKRGQTSNSWIRRIILPRGNMKVIHGRSEIQYCSNGRVLSGAATIVDITEIRHLLQGKYFDQSNLRLLTSKTGSFAWWLRTDRLNTSFVNIEIDRQDRWAMPNDWHDECLNEFQIFLKKTCSRTQALNKRRFNRSVKS